MMNFTNMMLALFFLFAQNVLAVDEMNICSICHLHSPLDCRSGVGVTHCPGSHEFCADCLQKWIRTKEEEQQDLDDYEIVVRCPLCNFMLPKPRHRSIIIATYEIAFKKFRREPSKKSFKKWMEWELKFLAFVLTPIVQRLYRVNFIDFWRNIDYLALFKRFFPIIIAYCIYLLFTIQNVGDLFKVSSITLKWPTYLPLAFLIFIIGLYSHKYVAAEHGFRALIKNSFVLARNRVTTIMQENSTHIIAVFLLWLVWAYQSFVYMGMFSNRSAFVLYNTFILVPFFINILYILFREYNDHNEQKMMVNFPKFLVFLYCFNEVAFRLFAPLFSGVIFPVFNASMYVGLWGKSILFNLIANTWSFLISMGGPLMAFIMNHPIYSFGALSVIFLSKLFFKHRKSN